MGFNIPKAGFVSCRRHSSASQARQEQHYVEDLFDDDEEDTEQHEVAIHDVEDMVL